MYIAHFHLDLDKKYIALLVEYSLNCMHVDLVSYSDKDTARCYKAVTCISKIFVFGPRLHFYENGVAIPDCDQEYIWIPEILAKLQSPINNITALPVLKDSNPLHFILLGFTKILGRNVASGINMLGELILRTVCIHTCQPCMCGVL